MKIETDWPVNSTRFLLPTVALRGFRAGPRTVTVAWWIWRVVFHLPNKGAMSESNTSPPRRRTGDDCNKKYYQPNVHQDLFRLRTRLAADGL